MPVPCLRPAQLATDTATSIDVLLYELDKLASEGKTFEYIILLEPTSPLRKPDDIANALTLLENTPNAESIVGVSKTEGQNPAFLTTIEAGFLRPYGRDFVNGIIPPLRRQEIEDVYFFEGSLYISQVNALRKKKGFYHAQTIPWTVPRWQSMEIDEECDFYMVEAIMKHMSGL